MTTTHAQVLQIALTNNTLSVQQRIVFYVAAKIGELEAAGGKVTEAFVSAAIDAIAGNFQGGERLAVIDMVAKAFAIVITRDFDAMVAA